MTERILTDRIIATVTRNLGRTVKDEHSLYGGGVAAKRIVEQLKAIGKKLT